MKNHENQFPKHLWGEVKERFVSAKTVEDYNNIRQELIDEWVIKYEGKTYTANIAGEKQVLPYYLSLVNALDTSGLIVELKLKPSPKNESTINTN